MTSSVDSFIASLVSQYSGSDDAGVVSTPVVKTSKKISTPKKFNDSDDLNAMQVNRNPAPPPVIPSLPAKGTLSARDFLLTIRKAQSRQESIAAIAGFIGYDSKGDFGSQDLAARAEAQRQLKPVSPKEYKRSCAPTVAGFVAGLPDNLYKKLADLNARQELATSNMLECLRKAEEAPNAILSQHFLHEAKLEQERLQSIQQDLSLINR